MEFNSGSDEYDGNQKHKTSDTNLQEEWLQHFPWLVREESYGKKCSVCNENIVGGFARIKQHSKRRSHILNEEFAKQRNVLSTSSSTACSTVQNMATPAIENQSELIKEEEIEISSNDEEFITVKETEDEFLNILTKYNMESYIFLLKARNVNLDCLKFIQEVDIRDIFGDDIGGRIKFRALVEEWRKSKNHGSISNSASQSLSEYNDLACKKCAPTTSSNMENLSENFEMPAKCQSISENSHSANKSCRSSTTSLLEDFTENFEMPVKRSYNITLNTDDSENCWKVYETPRKSPTMSSEGNDCANQRCSSSTSSLESYCESYDLPEESQSTPENNQSAIKRSQPTTSSPVLFNKSSKILTSKTKSFETPAKKSYKFNLETFLESNAGIEVKEKYEDKQRLSSDDRDKFITNIVKEHLQNDIPITKAMMEDITRDICRIFKTESKEYYYVRSPIPKGKLFNKYRSMANSYRNKGIFKARIRKAKVYKQPYSRSRKQHETIKTPNKDVEIMPESKCLEKEWLQKQNIPWEEVETNWKNCFEIRRAEILKKMTSRILLDWPLLMHRNGFKLINIDFENLFPGKSKNLRFKWNAVEGKLMKACHKFVRLPEAIKIAKQLSSNPDLRCYDIFRILQAVVKPVTRKTCANHIWKVSINDAWNSFAVIANSTEEIPSILKQRIHFCVMHEIALKPFLVILKGDSENNLQFALVADGITYMFSDFLEAFDTCFKMFHVLNFKYPFENIRFWHFVQTYFYDIDSKTTSFWEFESIIEIFKL